ncbi:hypothetical protein KsCSTR_35010 [Candidatus Kuenenia stuttgartiensis]|uniref:Methyltransferase type 11 domain-containing protein n=1 Tax=Kuenenia stuttgartiensis TaxID=174633 RepID=Q1Q6V3_KUEST|nr:methyltransferase domain-containing protein [Candidatus Kuenenia stuttgartiensis]QII12880.1 hypothetical protein KsCSTR_35010 [Candidatus Kuenenia stuttgartiensis]CAJ73310.1 unknown protein [Candidatus Kuenenia stuttgartiensis]
MKKVCLFLREKLWNWPDGLIWKVTEKLVLKSRREKFGMFMHIMRPTFRDTILDVGVTPGSYEWANFLENWYPFPERITALTIEGQEKFYNFQKNFPKVTLIFGNGKKLNFLDNSFDIVFSNAVVEHTGSREEQRQFIHEIVRVGKRAFITTPNYWFPADSHTLIPFAHYLPLKFRFWIYKKFGKESHADLNYLNLLTTNAFLGLFPKQVKVNLYKQRCFGMLSNLIAVVEK